jgi:hypothetical protein
MRVLGQIAAGLSILIVTIGVLTFIQFLVLRPPISPLMMFVWPFLYIGLNIAWIAVFLGMIVYGGVRSRPDLAFAPFIFAAIWMTASAAQRWWLQASLNPQIWSSSVSQDARAIRTLIMFGFDGIDRRIVADGRIDHLIKVWRDDHNKISSIEDVSIVRSDSCTAEEKQVSVRLYKLERPDQCYKSHSLAEIPDGLVVERVSQLRHRTETQARMRIQGKERLLLSWYTGVSSVLSYFPTFNLPGSPTRIWEASLGITQDVRHGMDDNNPVKMVSTIYGVPPSYRQDLGPALPVVPPFDAADTLDFAVTFARQSDVSPKSVATLLVAARDKGLVDGRSIGIAATLVGHDNAGWNAATDFAKGLVNDQTEQLVEQMLIRLETANVCEDCVTSRHAAHPALWEWKLRERLSNPEAVQDRAIRILVHRHDLAMWQYEGALKIMAALGPQEYRAYDSYFEGSLLPLILLDDTSAYSDKAIAFLRTKPGQPTSQSMRLAAKLDLVRDRDLKEYIIRIWSADLRRLPIRGERPEKYEIAAKACKRIARIEDPVVGDQDFPVDCSFPSK